MFNLINIGERSGSGVPLILNTWEDEGWEKPVIEERFDPDRTILELEFVKKTSEENKRRKQAKKNRRSYRKDTRISWRKRSIKDKGYCCLYRAEPCADKSDSGRDGKR